MGNKFKIIVNMPKIEIVFKVIFESFNSLFISGQTRNEEKP